MPAEPPSSCSRRTLLARALVAAAVCEFAPLVAFAAPLAIPVENVSRLYTVEVARVETPADTEAVVRALRDWPGKVAIGGGRFSMGGQIAIAGGLHLDMRQMKRVLWLRAAEHRVRVQAGITWRDLQDVLDPQDLAVRTMQSFSNFTVGGAVSVNCHGRYVGHGPISHSVRALQLVLADGRVVEASRQENPELLAAAVGGYGAIGVITEVELDLDDNTKMERRIENVPLADYPKYFAAKVLSDRDSVMHNADLIPPQFDAPVAITWRRSDKPLTRPQRLVPRGQTYTMKRQALWALTELPGAASLREPATAVARHVRPEVAWRNHEASLDLPAQQAVGEWTRELIDATLRHEGRYYLPYQLHATREQFERAYPEVAQLRQLKSRIDPQGRFSNSLWQKYL
jgi:FAD/FMN-containing dehydrogenase